MNGCERLDGFYFDQNHVFYDQVSAIRAIQLQPTEHQRQRLLRLDS